MSIFFSKRLKIKSRHMYNIIGTPYVDDPGGQLQQCSIVLVFNELILYNIIYVRFDTNDERKPTVFVVHKMR